VRNRTLCAGLRQPSFEPPLSPRAGSGAATAACGSEQTRSRSPWSTRCASS